MPASIGRAATNTIGAPTQSSNPYAKEISATVSPDGSVINHELMPYAAPIKTGAAMKAYNQPVLFDDIPRSSFAVV